jgi:hypothetical protein
MENTYWMTMANTHHVMDAYILNIRRDPQGLFQGINLIGHESDTPDLGRFYMDNRNMTAILSVIETSPFSAFLGGIVINCPILNDGSIGMLYRTLQTSPTLLPFLDGLIIKGGFRSMSSTTCDVATINCLLSQGPANDMAFEDLHIQSFDMTNTNEAMMVHRFLIQKTNICHLDLWNCNFNKDMDLTWLLSGLQKTSALEWFGITTSGTSNNGPLGDAGATKIIECLHKWQIKSLHFLKFSDSFLGTQAYLAIASMLTDPNTTLQDIGINDDRNIVLATELTTKLTDMDNMLRAMEFNNSTLERAELSRLPHPYGVFYTIRMERIMCRNDVLRRLMSVPVTPLAQMLPIACRCWEHCKLGPSPTYWLLRSCYPHFSVAISPGNTSLTVIYSDVKKTKFE